MVLVSLFTLGCWAQADPLANRVLVVHNSHPAWPESLQVADFYRNLRGITRPSCGIQFSSNFSITETEWRNTSLPALQACLNAAGRQQILYIVFAYFTPFRMDSVNGRGTHAVDSYAADPWGAYSAAYYASVPSGPHGYYADAQSQGNVYAPALTLAEYRNLPRSQTIYSVWRLDGPTQAAAQAMASKAVSVQAAGGLDATAGGIAYLDRAYQPGSIEDRPSDFGLGAGDWDLISSANMLRAAGWTVHEDVELTEIGVAPSILLAPNASLYCGWYSLGHYYDVYTWRDGAVGWHMDSSSGPDARGGPSWVPNAIRRGITVTSGAVNEPFLEGLPRADGVFRQLLAGANVGDAFLRNTVWLRWVMINYGDPLYRPFPGGRAPFIAPAETSLALTPRFAVGGRGTVRGSVTLALPAPAGGTAVSLAIGPGSFLSIPLPSSVTVPAGARSATFDIATPEVVSELPIHITAGLPVGRSNTLRLLPLLANVQAPATMQAGTARTAAVVLNERAPAGGSVVQLTSNHAGVTVPGSVTVPFGAVAAVFTVTVSPGAAAGSDAVIAATLLGARKEANVRIAP
jgi:uncharacterized protein (TIGR03790 family)